MNDRTVPNKLYFRIGEVADLLSIKPYVLRYWETEFPVIKPSKSKSGQRLYKKRDVEILLKIRELLYEERFTINGARKRLREIVKEERVSEADGQIDLGFEARGGSPHSGSSATGGTPSGGAPSQGILNHKLFDKIKKDLEAVLASLQN